jgi:ACS family hexuronate transporter-like MFS transporter
MGAFGIALMQKLAGYIVQWTGSYSILFMISASMYLVALGVIHLFSPRLEQAKLD